MAPKGVFECLSVNLALQKFFQPINFRFTQTTKRLQPVTATRIFLPRAIKYHKINESSRGKWPTVSLFFTTFMANLSTELSASCSGLNFSLLQVSRHVYTSGPGTAFDFCLCPQDGRWPMANQGSGPDSS